MRLATAEAHVLSTAALGRRPFLPPDPIGSLRAVADRVEREVSPHPLAGLRGWLDGSGPSARATAFPAAELAAGERIEELMGTAAALWGGSPHAHAALAWKTYCYWTLAPVVLGYLAGRRVPVMDAANTVFSVADDAPMFSVRQIRPRFLALPHDPSAPHPDVEVVADEAVLLDRLRTTVFDAHLAPVLEAFLARVRVGRRTLMGSVASGVAYAVASIAQVVPDPDEVLAKTLLDALEVGDLVDVGADEAGRLVYRRRTCCLALTIDGDRTCSTCCVRTERR
ncbi:ferric iron reductase [Glycomyces sp. TRM65418]|uniref:ferric iron reductase n=1 Tax=Glycomyces sp. TRM65418 TaxID=2867006 RepID=UPI001CE58803|nr:ferric iron reductase [Glycomyces sp. TRM65418]MCC3763870.1 ferric iron reductase [Glycomyces sp. TRM65418]QZD53573.1 ferric iron reductase [Glycomyces sp. TRM65418]